MIGIKKLYVLFFFLIMTILFSPTFYGNEKEDIQEESESMLIEEELITVYQLADIEEVEKPFYYITKQIEELNGENFSGESYISYPQIEVVGEPQLTEKINIELYGMAIENYDSEIANEVNVHFVTKYRITYANDNYISIFYSGVLSTGSGFRSFALGVTIDLETGNTMSLNDFGVSDNEIFVMLDDTNLYSSDGFASAEYWIEKKEEMFNEWKDEEKSHTYGYYLTEGRLGIIFPYKWGNKSNSVIEFTLDREIY